MPLRNTDIEWERYSGVDDSEQRFALYRLCECSGCKGVGKVYAINWLRCSECRGEGRVRELLATAGSAEAVGVALVTLARESEWQDCPLGLLERGAGKNGAGKWLILPWLPSARNVSDAGRTLARSKKPSATQ